MSTAASEKGVATIYHQPGVSRGAQYLIGLRHMLGGWAHTERRIHAAACGWYLAFQFHHVLTTQFGAVVDIETLPSVCLDTARVYWILCAMRVTLGIAQHNKGNITSRASLAEPANLLRTEYR